MIRFAAYAPDQPDYFSAGAPTITNVIPTVAGYKPFPSLAVISAALAAEPKGFFFNIEDDGTVTIFAATATKLYKLNTSDYSWDDVSRVSSAYTGNSTDGWTFARFGDRVIATNGADEVQTYTVGTSTNFDDLAGSPPVAKRVAVVGDYVVLYGLPNNPTRVQWSGTNNSEQWTPNKGNSDYQDFPGGGEVIFVAPVDQNAMILQRFKRRIMIYAPDSPALFQFREVEDRGAESYNSCTTNGTEVYFRSQDGFFKATPNSPAIPIGAERVDVKFQDDTSSLTNYALVKAANDPINKLIVWAYSSNGTTLDKALGYAWQQDKWVNLSMDPITDIGQGAALGFTLEQIGALYATLEDVPGSFDSPRWLGGRPLFAAFDENYKLGFFDGANLEATLDTADLSFKEGRRAKVRAFRPLTDAANAVGRVGVKRNWNDSITWSSEASMSSSSGRCSIVKSGFLHRFRLRVPAGETWTNVTGIDAIESSLLGTR